MEELGADKIREILATVTFRLFCPLFYVSVKLGLSH